jgi:acylphosphatase
MTTWSRRTGLAYDAVIARRIVVHGFVQGVGFRYWLVRAAESRGVAGWVRNRSDGTVEALFEGDAESVDSLIRACGQGPRGASVARLDVSEAAPSGLADFSIA